MHTSRTNKPTKFEFFNYVLINYGNPLPSHVRSALVYCNVC